MTERQARLLRLAQDASHWKREIPVLLEIAREARETHPHVAREKCAYAVTPLRRYIALLDDALASQR